MKAVTFQKPVEYCLQIEGESWAQGTAVSGTLEVKSHGTVSEPNSAGKIQLILARGELKKVHEKRPGAFTEIAKFDTETWLLPPVGESATFSWNFDLDRNCPITDSSGSLFFLYGHATTLDTLGQIQLNIVSEPVLQAFLHAFNVHFRFVIKTQRWSKAGTTSTKLAPPDAKKFSNLDLLVLTSRFTDEDLELTYEFNVKKFEATAVSIETKKEKREYSQVLRPIEYRLPSGRLNTDYFEKLIDEALTASEAL